MNWQGNAINDTSKRPPGPEHVTTISVLDGQCKATYDAVVCAVRPASTDVLQNCPVPHIGANNSFRIDYNKFNVATIATAVIGSQSNYKSKREMHDVQDDGHQ